MHERHQETYRSEMERNQLSERKKMRLWRDVFSTPQGRVVLLDLLNDLRYYDVESNSNESEILRRAAMRVLVKLGIYHPSNLFAHIDAMLSVPIPPERQEKEKQ